MQEDAGEMTVPEVDVGTTAGGELGPYTSLATVPSYWAMSFPQRPEPLYKVSAEFTGHAELCPHTNFTKGVKWSPDGACLLTASDDNWMRIFDLPMNVSETLPIAPAASTSGRELSDAPDNLSAALRMHVGETVYDYGWYPRMTATDAASCCFAASARGQPIHLWDACNGGIRCTYRGYNDVDEVTPAYSLAFSSDGSQLFAGYAKCIKVFTVTRPGRDSAHVATYKRKREASLQGIVSCMASSADGTLLAAGSYGGGAALLDQRTHEMLMVLEGHKGGLTQVQFSADGAYLFTGARQDPHIMCWDVRYTSDVVYRMQRDTVTTNQRIHFDIEPYGRHLLSGGCSGCVRVFDLQTGEALDDIPVAGPLSSTPMSSEGGVSGAGSGGGKDGGQGVVVNGLSIHPYMDVLATATGQRQFRDPCTSGRDDSESDTRAAARDGDTQQPWPEPLSNALLLWRSKGALVQILGEEEGGGVVQ